MPLYEYQCPRCGRFEIIRKFSDAPLLACPTCGGEIQKVLSAPAIQFKGTGWYITDYARKSGSGKDTSSKGGEGGSPSGSKDGGSASKDSGTKAAAAADSSTSKGSGGSGQGGGSSTS